MLRSTLQSAYCRSNHHVGSRVFSSNPATVTVTRTASRLEALRHQLAQEDAALDDFVDAAPPRPKNKKAPPRSAKILPKPRWLKAAPADSENYKQLRQTVRELGLATVCEGMSCKI